MKKIYSCIVLMTALSLQAQNAQLFQNTWYLSELIQNNTSLLPPSDGSVPFTPLVFTNGDSYGLSTSFCNALQAYNLIFDDGNSSFSYSEMAATLGFCPVSANNMFDNYYLGFYLANAVPITMTYVITPQNDYFRLTVTNGAGDKAVYNSTLLGTFSPDTKTLVAYPNPTQGILHLERGNSPDTTTVIQVFNALGQEVLTQTYDTFPDTLNLTGCKAGIYCVTLKSGAQTKVIKVVKI